MKKLKTSRQKSKKYCVSLPIPTHDWAVEEARRNGQTFSSMVNLVLEAKKAGKTYEPAS